MEQPLKACRSGATDSNLTQKIGSSVSPYGARGNDVSAQNETEEVPIYP